MSYILEALRKAERERSLGRIPNVGSLQAMPLSSPKRRWIWLGVGFVLSFNAAAWIMVAYPWKEWINVAVEGAESLRSVPAETGVVKSSEAVELEEEPTQSVQPDVAFSIAPTKSAPAIDASPNLPETPQVAVASVSTVVDKPLPFTELSEEFRRTLPELHLDVHVYSEVPDQSFVMINARHYKNRTRLAEGPWLETIAEKGVVLRYAGQRFLLPVQR